MMLSDAHKNLVDLGLATRFDLPFDADALADAERKLKDGPGDYHLWCARGILCMRKQPEDAVESFSRALQLRPLSANAAYNRGRVLTVSGRYAQAAADLSLATSLDADDPWKWHFYGTALYFLNRFEDACGAFYRALDGQRLEGADLIPFELDWIWNCLAKLGDEQGLRDCVKDINADVPIDPREITFKERVLVYAGCQTPEEMMAKVPADNFQRICNQMFCVSNYDDYLEKDYKKAWGALRAVLDTEAGSDTWGYKMAVRERDERRARAGA